jgi:hypothetical protein
MALELTLKTNKQPTLFNKDMVLGTLLGLMIPGGLILKPFILLGSAAVGGYIGKSTQERENREGKKVNEASFWNKDTLIGGLMGMEIGTIIGAVAFIALLAAPAVAVGALLTSAVGGTVMGTYFGGKMGEHQQAKEYEEAKRQLVETQIGKAIAPQLAQEPELGHGKKFVQAIDQERLLAMVQDPNGRGA